MLASGIDYSYLDADAALSHGLLADPAASLGEPVPRGSPSAGRCSCKGVRQKVDEGGGGVTSASVVPRHPSLEAQRTQTDFPNLICAHSWQFHVVASAQARSRRSDTLGLAVRQMRRWGRMGSGIIGAVR